MTHFAPDDTAGEERTGGGKRDITEDGNYLGFLVNDRYRRKKAAKYYGNWTSDGWRKRIRRKDFSHK